MHSHLFSVWEMQHAPLPLMMWEHPPVPQTHSSTLCSSLPLHSSLSLCLFCHSHLWGILSSIVWGVFQSLDRQTDERLKDCCVISVAVRENRGGYLQWTLRNLQSGARSVWLTAAEPIQISKERVGMWKLLRRVVNVETKNCKRCRCVKGEVCDFCITSNTSFKHPVNCTTKYSK